MEFIKRMKTREFIEMGLKTLASVLAGLIVIILMEAMIYSIFMKTINKTTSISGDPSKAEYYITECGDGTYDIYKHMPSMDSKQSDPWARLGNHHNISKAKLDELLREKGFLSGYNADLYKVVATNTETNAKTTYEKTDATNSSPEAQIVANKDTLQEGYTFDVYIRATAETAYDETAPKFANLTYTELNAKFEKAGELKEYSTAKIYWRAPNCFDIYMNAWHYVVMVIFELAICGFYTWRFMLINKEYKKIEKKFKKTGKVFA